MTYLIGFVAGVATAIVVIIGLFYLADRADRKAARDRDGDPHPADDQAAR